MASAHASYSIPRRDARHFQLCCAAVEGAKPPEQSLKAPDPCQGHGQLDPTGPLPWPLALQLAALAGPHPPHPRPRPHCHIGDALRCARAQTRIALYGCDCGRKCQCSPETRPSRPLIFAHTAAPGARPGKAAWRVACQLRMLQIRPHPPTARPAPVSSLMSLSA